MKAYKQLIGACMALAVAFGASAQYTQSPYSYIGYGELGGNATGVQRQMGGVGYAMPGHQNVNAINPASYATTDSLTFLWEIGADLSQLWATENGEKGKKTGGGLDYITSQFRVAKNVGMSFGLVPFSAVGYEFANEIDNGTESRSGSGALSHLYVGAAWSPIKNFSFGANISYLFGTLSNATIVETSSIAGFYRDMQVRDWDLQLGAQYFKSIGKKDRLGVGVMFSPKKSLHGKNIGTQYDSSEASSSSTGGLDTMAYYDMKGNYEKPNTFGVGVSYSHGSKIFAEIDFTYQDWSKVKYTSLENFEAPNISFNNRWKLAGGLQWVPDERGNYFSRIAYRFGAFYNSDYQNVLGNKLRDYGLSLGFGFPALGSKSVVNLGVEWKHRYTAPTSLIKENYLNITLGITFNEMWFWQNKIR